LRRYNESIRVLFAFSALTIEKPKPRKSVTRETYSFEDLQGLNVTRGHYKKKILGPDAAIPQTRQQWAILRSPERRYGETTKDGCG
jgi:hypothetical protein